MKMKADDKLMSQAMADPKNKGKHIIVVKNQLYTTKSSEKVIKILEKLIKEYPKEIPHVGYAIQADSLILSTR